MTNITLAPVQPDQPTHLMATYGRQAISFVRGRGAYLYTADGTEYLDALTGIAVCGLGHAHPVIAEAIAEQAATLIHTSNLFEICIRFCMGTNTFIAEIRKEKNVCYFPKINNNEQI